LLATCERTDPAFRSDVLAGLAAPVPAIPARWLYDEAGSKLFDAITRLPAYYPTRVETALLEASMPDMARLIGRGRAVVEFGAGSAAKTPILLRSIDPSAYVPIDISGEYLRSSAAELQSDFPRLRIIPVEADFMHPVQLPDAVKPLPKLCFFPGSTIGNLVPSTSIDLLRRMRAMLGTGARLLIGLDRIKATGRLLAAYDDPEGVTAAFNLNLLRRINRELDGTIPLDAFAHEARWNDHLARIEMHLVALRDVAFTVGGQPFAFRRGETIHTENSHKYGTREARLLLLGGTWTPIGEWMDAAGDFMVILAEAQPERFAP
jgi:dimethylhistidine N-methyltransferase